MGDKATEPQVQFDGDSGRLVIDGDLGRLVWGAVAESLDGDGTIVETAYHNRFCAEVLGRVATIAQDQTAVADTAAPADDSEAA